MEKNLKKAYIYLNMAKNNNNPEVLFSLFLLHAHLYPGIEPDEYHVPQNKELALEYFKKAALLGHNEAQIEWSKILWNTRSQLNDEEANHLINWLKKFSKDNFLFRASLGILYAQGYKNLIPIDYSKALRLLQEAAEHGEEMGLSNLGYAHHHGIWGVEQSWEKAAYYYKKCTAHLDALCNLGFLYENGQGVKKDIQEAIRLYELALNNGHSGAANNLGALYQRGENVPQNDELAVKYYKQGWELGDPNAALQYAKYLWVGLCCPNNPETAKNIVFNLDENDENVLFTQAVILLNEDPKKAREKLLQSMKLGSEWAYYIYGLELYQAGVQMHEEENSLPSITDAIECLKKSADLGLDQATSALRILQKNYQGYEGALSDIIRKFLAGNIEQAREIMQDVQTQKSELNQEKVDLDSDPYVKQLSTKDLKAAEKRHNERLEEFLDPKNRKSISVKDLQKIASHAMNDHGGHMEPTKGSGKKIKVGDQTLGYHDMHRSGQSSNATLDPGRAKSFQNFVKSLPQESNS